jgi:hypothetical protein
MIPWRGSLKLMILVAALHADATGADADAVVIDPSAGNNAEAVSAIAQQMEIFGRDLEQLRLFMGAARVSELDIGIRSAIPRDLYCSNADAVAKIPIG